MSTAKAQRPYPIGSPALGTLADASYWLRMLIRDGTREPYGLAPNRPLTPRMARDAATAQRAIMRFIEADQRNRNG